MTIRVNQLEKRHPGTGAAALAGLCLEVAAGKGASVLGRGGAGETAVLRRRGGLDAFGKGTRGREAPKTGITQTLVTHDIKVAREASAVIFVLDAGRVVESGSPAEVLDSPKHEATKALLAQA